MGAAAWKVVGAWVDFTALNLVHKATLSRKLTLLIYICWLAAQVPVARVAQAHDLAVDVLYTANVGASVL